MTARAISMTEAAELFRNHAQRVVVIGHVNPDGDALGAACAVMFLARQLGKEAWFSFAWPDAVPETLLTIPGVNEYCPPQQLPQDPDFVVVVDCSSADRIGSLARIATSAPHCLIIDHHRSADGTGTHSVIEPTADSTTQLVLRFSDALGAIITPQIAQCLFSGLVTDTGCFRWGSQRTFEDAARLVGYGLDIRTIVQPLLDERPFSYLTFLGTVLQQTRLYSEVCSHRGVVIATIPHDLYATCRPDDVTALIDVLRTAQDAEVAIALREMVPGQWTGSLRSHTNVNAHDVAAHFGGGGHRRAAGFTVTLPLDDIIDKLLELLEDPPLDDGPRC